MYSKQHKRKALLTRISSILLSTALAFTSLPVTNVYATEKTDSISKSSNKTSNTDSFADDIAGSSGTKKGEGSTNQAETLEGSLYGLDFSQGLRFYLVNQDLERITDCYNFLFDEKFTNYTYKAAYNETRFDTTDSPQNHKYYSMSKLQEWCTIEKTTEYEDPKPPLVGLECKGAEFKDWLRNGLAMTGGPGGLLNYGSANANNSGGSTTGTGLIGAGGNKVIEEELPVDQPLTYEQKISSYIELIEEGKDLYDTSVDREYILDEYIKKRETEIKNSGSVSISNGVTQLDWLMRDLYEDELNKKIANTANSYFDTYVGYIKSYWKYTAMTLEDCRYAALSKIYDKMLRGLAYEYNFNVLVLQNLFKGTGYINPGLLGEKYQSTYAIASNLNSSTDLLSTNIPLANEDFSNATEQQANSPIFCMTNKSDTLVIYDTVKYGTNAASAMIEHGCYIVIEPVLICKIMRQSGIHNYQQSCLARHYDADYSIGSVWNIIHNWGGTATSSYTPRLESYFPNSFITTKLYESPTGKKILPVEDPNANFYTNPENRMAELEEAMPTLTEAGGQVKGIAMHIFSALDLFSDSSTSTYDKGLGETIGAAPDPTNLPTESQYPISKNITIIKNYVTVDSLGNETVDGNFIRNQNPHIIQILDEPLYKVVDWQTDNKTTSILSESDNGNTTITYNQLVQNSSKIQSGTTENNITLSINEYTLYVKLQKQESPTVQNNRLISDFVLRESEIARAVSTNTIIPIQINYDFPDISLNSSGHNSHSYNHRDLVINGIKQYNSDGSVKRTSDDCDGLSPFSDGNITDNKIVVKPKNAEESSYSNIIVQSNISKFNSYINTETLYRNNKSAETKQGNHIYYFTIYRTDNGESTLKLAKYNQKQSSNKDVSVGTTQTIAAGNKDIAKTLGYSEANSKSTKSRAEIDYKIPVTFKFIFDTSSPDKSTTFRLNQHTADCGHSEGGNSKSADVTSTTEIISTNDISVQVYSGTSNKQLHNSITNPITGKYGELYLPYSYGGYNKAAGRMIRENATIKFSPFIRMVYSTTDDMKNSQEPNHGGFGTEIDYEEKVRQVKTY